MICLAVAVADLGGISCARPEYSQVQHQQNAFKLEDGLGLQLSFAAAALRLTHDGTSFIVMPCGS